MKPTSDFFKKKIKAFNLKELMVVFIIFGILVLISLPSLILLISKAKSTEAQVQLENSHSIDRTHFSMNLKNSSFFKL